MVPLLPPNQDVHELAQERVGTVLCDRWHVDRLIGTGGMADVYAATHRNKKRVALKVLHAAYSANDNVRLRFLREAYAANTVDHPGTVSIFDDGVTDDGCALLVMELLDGEPLGVRAQANGGALDWKEVLEVAERILDVLQAAHTKGIIHRDIKPDNVFRLHDGTIKVLDFGIARLLDSASSVTGGTTELTMMLGTPGFMPPEQALGHWDCVGQQSDLWSVGATMFSLLTGQLVHSSATVQEAMVKAATQHAPPVEQLRPELPRAVAEIVNRALSFDRSDRWPDAKTMRQAILAVQRNIAEGRSLESVRPAFDAASSESPRNAQRIAVGAAIATITLGILLAVGTMALSQPREAIRTPLVVDVSIQRQVLMDLTPAVPAQSASAALPQPNTLAKRSPASPAGRPGPVAPLIAQPATPTEPATPRDPFARRH